MGPGTKQKRTRVMVGFAFSIGLGNFGGGPSTARVRLTCGWEASSHETVYSCYSFMNILLFSPDSFYGTGSRHSATLVQADCKERDVAKAAVEMLAATLRRLRSRSAGRRSLFPIASQDPINPPGQKLVLIYSRSWVIQQFTHQTGSGSQPQMSPFLCSVTANPTSSSLTMA
jgi:hypothetical protein